MKHKLESLLARVANELEVERGVKKTDIKIKDNPGFKTEITLDLETATLKIVTENINNLNYLYTLPIYFDTMIRLTQDKSSTYYPVSEINKLCGSNEAVDITFPDKYHLLTCRQKKVYLLKLKAMKVLNIIK